MAFQPIIDLRDRSIFSHEALVRGPQGQSAASILSQVNDTNRYAFDQACRVKAIAMASRLKLEGFLNINFLPNAVYEPEACLRHTIKAAETYDFPIDRIVFEITEGEKVEDHAHLIDIIKEYKRRGLKTAIDDFGAGYSGLNLLVEFQPDIIKLDMHLTRAIDQDPVRRAIVRGILGVCRELGLSVIAEGIETQEESDCLADMGIRLMQGFLYARPAFESVIAADSIVYGS